jgi:hypothetical protein
MQLRLLAVVPLLAACATTPGSGSGPGSGPGAGPDAVQLDGTYQLANRLDLASAGVLPDLASSTLESLSQLQTDPAGAIIGILEATNAPVISTLLSALPDIVTQQLAGFIDDYIVGELYQNVPVTDEIAGIVQDTAQLVTQFELDTTLVLSPPDAMGMATATHAVAGVTFSVGDQKLVVTAPELLSDVTQASLDATALHIVEQSPDVENGLLDLGDHAFAVPIGDYAIQGLDQLLMAELGQPDLRSALGSLIDCAGLAQNVANECIVDVCVGHQDEIQSVCESGLDLIASDVEAELHSITIQAMHFHSGEAKMWDAPTPDGPTDGVIDRIDGGTWTLGIGLTSDEHPTQATFTGTRVDAATPAPQ